MHQVKTMALELHLPRGHRSVGEVAKGPSDTHHAKLLSSLEQLPTAATLQPTEDILFPPASGDIIQIE